VRPSGEALKGFGGVANPVKVESLYTRCAEILSKAVGRKLNSVECCLLIDEAALVVVAGNIRRCLPKGSLVHTQSGLVPIEKVRIGDMVLTSKGFYPVTDFFDQGEQALCRIETVEGHVLECTKDHKIAVMLSGEHYRMDKAEDLLDVDFLLGLDATTNELKPVAIKSIEYDVRTDHTFDIEVSTVHEFVCNGLLVSNSAGMRQFSENDTLGMTAKDNLWQQNAVTGKWQIDPERDALRMANHTRVFHHKPSLDECIASVTKQYFSGEGAIQYAPEAVARANADLLPIDSDAKTQFLKAYEDGIEAAKKWLVGQFPSLTERELEHRFQRYGLNPCGEIIGSNFFCNLAEIHLNQISPTDFVDQEKAFMAGALSVSVLLNHQFVDQRYKESREADPIVGVSITGLFDFFVNAFGVNWLQWWADGRCDWYLIWSEFVAICPDNQILTQFDIDLESYRCMIDDRVFYSCSQLYRDLERHYLSYWRMITFETVAGYCEHHGLKTPSRCTTGQPAGTKSLLTGASPGWHPPKAQRFIRRITFRKNDPVALACIDYGYNVIPSQSDKDENGHLLDDPFDPRCTEWLVEIPVEVPWANLDGADRIDISRFSALAQFDFYMQVQKYYTSHNTSSTIELRQHEIEALAKRIYDAIQNDEGYISSALLARFDDLQTFPRLPFEPIDKRTYDRLFAEMLLRRKELDFHEALMKYDDGGNIVEAGPAGCDSDKCLISGSK
jgi:ribonucleotide reductase class II